jgi:adenylosuccinate lyase
MSILADRYASSQMREIWSRSYKIQKERELWVAILTTQKKLGLEIPDSVIQDYASVIKEINLESIDARELKVQHDVMARIEEFNDLAGHQKIHVGMTSRDITENVEIFQIRESLELIHFKSQALLSNLLSMVELFSDTAFVARTHNVPAQITTLGRRFCIWAEELEFAERHLIELLARLPLRGIKGPIGTSQDLVQLFGLNAGVIDEELAAHWEFESVLNVPSQIYPRSIDFEVVSTLSQIAASPANIATNVRLMAGNGLLYEGFSDSQVGSSAMPHKNNPRLSERVNGLHAVLKGFVTMIHELVGNQWNEGDVSCSVVRRVAISDAFFTVDAILDTTIRILQNIKVDSVAITKEIADYLPFLVSSRVLGLAVERGLGRDDAHALIKKYSILARENMSLGRGNNFLELCCADSNLGITANELQELLNLNALIAPSKRQSDAFVRDMSEKYERLSQALNYVPTRTI